jgi:hypothetical protein
VDPITRFDGENEFLSNFFFAKVVWEDIEFPTSEHAFQADKTLNMEERRAIAALSTPGKAKRAGKRVKLRPDWDKIRVDRMLAIVEAKFKQNPELMERLIATGDAELIEGNTWNDTFWGVCRGKGRNILGKILMIVRDEEAQRRGFLLEV